MTRISIAPFRNFDSIGEGFQNLLDHIPTTWELGQHYLPLIDVYEDNTNLYIDAELPGMKKEDVKITVHKGVLTLTGERDVAKEDESVRFLRRERTAGSFTRSLTLPVEVDVNKVEATFSNGVLRISMPKANPKDIERSIEIR